MIYNKAKIYLFLSAIIVLCIATIFVILLQAKEKDEPMPGNKSVIIKLPEPAYKSNISVEETLLKRRSVRDYKDKPLTLAEVSQLLWAAQGSNRFIWFQNSSFCRSSLPS